ncbi:MAG: hypothetical protein V7739_18830 [Motiliproteus sp.]
MLKTRKDFSSELKKMSDQLSQLGTPTGYGCTEERFDELLGLARGLNETKPVRIVSKWMWLDIDYTEDPITLKELIEKNLQPSRLKIRFINFDETEEVRGKTWFYSSYLVSLHKNALVETEDFFYILFGSGIRRCLTPEDVNMGMVQV